MTKVIGMLVVLAVFAAMPVVAFGQGGGGYGDTVSSGDAVVRGGDVTGGYDGGGEGGDVGVGCAISQAAGGDATATNNCGNTTTQGAGGGQGGGQGGGVTGVGGGVGGGQGGGQGGGVTGVGGGVGGGGVQGVTLARTGFDAWLLAALGGLSLAGGLGLLAAQRRGRIGA